MSDDTKTRQQLDAVNDVIAEGVASVKDGEKTVTFRSLADLYQIAEGLQAKANKRPRRMFARPIISKDL